MYYHSRRHTTDSWWLKIENCTKKLPVRIALVSTVVVATFLYVFQTNHVTASGYTVSQLSNQIKTLEADNRQLDVSLAQAQSIARLTNELAEKGYIPVEHVEYATLASAVVAKR